MEKMMFCLSSSEPPRISFFCKTYLWWLLCSRKKRGHHPSSFSSSVKLQNTVVRTEPFLHCRKFFFFSLLPVAFPRWGDSTRKTLIKMVQVCKILFCAIGEKDSVDAFLIQEITFIWSQFAFFYPELKTLFRIMMVKPKCQATGNLEAKGTWFKWRNNLEHESYLHWHWYE